MSSRHAPVKVGRKTDSRKQDVDSSSTSDSSPGSRHKPSRHSSHQAVYPRSNATGDMGSDKHRQVAYGRHSPGGSPLVPELQSLSHFMPYEVNGRRFDEQTSSPSSADADDLGNEPTSPSLSSSQEKRRAQNRSAQRAFRIRKIQKVQALEQNLAHMLAQHNELLTSYEKQEDELVGLRKRIAAMQAELAELRQSYGRDQEYGGFVVPDNFDGWGYDAFTGADGYRAHRHDGEFWG